MQLRKKCGMIYVYNKMYWRYFPLYIDLVKNCGGFESCQKFLYSSKIN